MYPSLHTAILCTMDPSLHTAVVCAMDPSLHTAVVCAMYPSLHCRYLCHVPIPTHFRYLCHVPIPTQFFYQSHIPIPTHCCYLCRVPIPNHCRCPTECEYRGGGPDQTEDTGCADSHLASETITEEDKDFSLAKKIWPFLLGTWHCRPWDNRTFISFFSFSRLNPKLMQTKSSKTLRYIETKRWHTSWHTLYNPLLEFQLLAFEAKTFQNVRSKGFHQVHSY